MIKSILQEAGEQLRGLIKATVGNSFSDATNKLLIAGIRGSNAKHVGARGRGLMELPQGPAPDIGEPTYIEELRCLDHGHEE